MGLCEVADTRGERRKAKTSYRAGVGAIMHLLNVRRAGARDRLPNERDLAHRPGPVAQHRAARRFVGLEMIARTPGASRRRHFRPSLDAPLLLEATGFAMQLMRDHEVCGSVGAACNSEGAAAGLARPRASPTSSCVRSCAGSRSSKARQPPTSCSKADIAFHAVHRAGAHNVVLASLLDTFSARTIRARHLNAGLGLDEALMRSRCRTGESNEAVAARDPEAARATASVHVANLARMAPQRVDLTLNLECTRCSQGGRS